MIYNIGGTQLGSPCTKNGIIPNNAYNKNGVVVWQKQPSREHAVSDTFTQTELFVLTGSTYGSGTQGIACDSISQEVAQLYTGKIITVDIDDGSYVQRASVFNLGHGSAGQFSNQKASETDLYPPLYVSTGSSVTVDSVRYGQLLEVYLGESTSKMNRVFYIPIDTVTNGQTAIDFDNNILYHVTREKYEPDSGETIDYTYVYAYDMTQYESLSGVSYSPKPQNGYKVLTTLLDKFTVPFISEMQGVAFFDGLIACLSDSEGVVFIDVETHSIYLRIPASQVLQREREGIGFIYNPQTGQTDMVVSARYSGGTHFHRFQFDLN